MTILAVGRAFDGLDVAPWTIEWRGDVLHLEGAVSLPYSLANVGKIRACRDRILALPTARDEDTVAVRYTADGSFNGYFSPQATQVSEPLHGQVTCSVEWTMDLLRAGGATLSQVETYAMHAVRTNPHSISAATLNGVTPDIIKWIPSAAVDFWAGATTGSPSLRSSETGVLAGVDTKLTRPRSMVATYTVDPAEHYRGACEIRSTSGSAASQLVGGRLAHLDLSSGSVVLSNGLIRVSLYTGGGAGGTTKLFVEAWDGSTTWEPVGGSSSLGWVLTNSGSGGVAWDWAGSAVDILRNGPERASIRLVPPFAFLSMPAFGRTWLDLTVRRGARHIEGYLQSDSFGSGLAHSTLKPSSSIASTALTGGLRATSNDAFGNRAVWGVAGTNSVSNNTTTGEISQVNQAAAMPFVIGVEVGGTGASSPDQAQQILYEYYDVHSEAQRIVRR